MKIRIVLITFPLQFFLLQHAHAQKKAGSGLFRQFLEVCNNYKTTPLHLSVEMRKINTLTAKGEDSTTAIIDFFMKQREAYIKFEDAEQLVSDSLVLTVFTKNRQMILSAKALSLEDMMKAVPGATVNDAAIKGLNDKYTVAKENINKTVDKITLTGKKNLYGTAIPAETVVLIFDNANKWPQQITSTRKTLLLKKPTDNKQETASLHYPVKEVLVEGKGTCLVKEEISSFLFNKIEHDQDMQLPVTLTDRIQKTGSGYVPVKAFENYMIIHH
jgi:hypothetical protein